MVMIHDRLLAIGWKCSISGQSFWFFTSTSVTLCRFVSDIAIFVLKGDVKLQLTNCHTMPMIFSAFYCKSTKYSCRHGCKLQSAICRNWLQSIHYILVGSDDDVEASHSWGPTNRFCHSKEVMLSWTNTGLSNFLAALTLLPYLITMTNASMASTMALFHNECRDASLLARRMFNGISEESCRDNTSLLLCKKLTETKKWFRSLQLELFRSSNFFTV